MQERLTAAAHDDDRDTIDAVVEELLRWIVTSPMQARVLTADTVFEGLDVPKGTPVKVLQATLDFDEDRYPEPLVFDPTRTGGHHTAFGLGTHRCLGSHLARLELRVALREWHKQIPRYHLPADYVVSYTPSLRGVSHLPLEFPAA